MDDMRAQARTDSTLRWGGRAGIGGSVLLLFLFGFVAAFVGMGLTPEQSLMNFPGIRSARVMENSLYLGVLLLWLVHALALHRALRRTSPTPALVGAVLSILGLALLIAGAIPHAATAALSDLYHAAEATPQDRATLVLVWHGIEAMFDALLYTGLVILPLSLLALGKAMLGAPGYGPRIGVTVVALGVVGLVSATAVLVGVTDLAAVGVFVLVGFHLVVGRRTHKLARTLPSRTLAGA